MYLRLDNIFTLRELFLVVMPLQGQKGVALGGRQGLGVVGDLAGEVS
jgi:hypothetical protein